MSHQNYSSLPCRTGNICNYKQMWPWPSFQGHSPISECDLQRSPLELCYWQVSEQFVLWHPLTADPSMPPGILLYCIQQAGDMCNFHNIWPWPAFQGHSVHANLPSNIIGNIIRFYTPQNLPIDIRIIVLTNVEHEICSKMWPWPIFQGHLPLLEASMV